MTTRLEQYIAVRHLPADKAAVALGCLPSTVRQYRKYNPATSHVPGPAQPRHGVVQHRVASFSPSTSVTAGPPLVMCVSLPAPPWGGGFQREGAML